MMPMHHNAHDRVSRIIEIRRFQHIEPREFPRRRCFFASFRLGSLLAVRGGEQLLKNDLPRPQNIPQFQLSLIHAWRFRSPAWSSKPTNGGQAANVRVPSLVNRFKRAIQRAQFTHLSRPLIYFLSTRPIPRDPKTSLATTFVSPLIPFIS